MRLDKPRLPVFEVSNNDQLASAVSAMSQCTHIAIDAERASGFRYSHKAYLIQVAVEHKGIWLIDPVSPEIDLAPLARVMESRTWLLHAATQDLPCLAELGIRPTSLIDTELSARLAGLERVGLGSLAQSLMDIELAKEHSAADWSKRPLSQEMLDYAALDVDVMFDLWRAIEQLLDEQGKSEWARQEFENLVNFRPKPPIEEPWRQLPGMMKVKDLAKLKIAASLHATRDSIAREQDVAPGRLIPDRSISAAAISAPKTKSELARNPDFQGRASRSMLSVWWEAIENSPNLDVSIEGKTKGSGIPNHKSWERRFPEAHLRLEKLRPKLLELALELNLPVENLLTPDYLRRVAFEPAEDVREQLRDLGARQWQIELVIEPILQGLLEAKEADPAA